MRPEKKPRFCVDYRELNVITEEESTAVPRITDALKGLSQPKVFTTLDLKSGYWQIPLAPKDAEKTAFTTPDGTAYQFRVMPFGLKNAPATFQKLMAGEVLTGLLHRFCCVYLDDVIIYSVKHTGACKTHSFSARKTSRARIENFGRKMTNFKDKFGFFGLYH